MSDLKEQLIRLGEKKPNLREHLRPVLSHIASRKKTANWWGVVMIYEKAGGIEIFTAGEQIITGGGSHSLDSVYRKATGKIKSLSSDVHDVVMQHFPVSSRDHLSDHVKLQFSGDLKNAYVGYSNWYSFETGVTPDDIAETLKEQGIRAYIRPNQTP